MSKSRLNEKVYYPEIKDLDEEDKNIDANLYEIQIENVDVFIAIGEAKYTFIEEGIVYYPVYIIKNDLVDKQIGVFDVLANKVPYCTNMSTAKVCLEGIKSLKLKDISVTSLQDL